LKKPALGGAQAAGLTKVLMEAPIAGQYQTEGFQEPGILI